MRVCKIFKSGPHFRPEIISSEFPWNFYYMEIVHNNFKTLVQKKRLEVNVGER